MRRVIPFVPVVALVLVSCSTDDGRAMRPPDAGQTESVAIATTTVTHLDLHTEVAQSFLL
ncbi:MAG: hypothetical protein ACKO1X_02215 [Acidimicrobiales bacterium]